MTDNPSDYEVGYGKPPLSGRIKKGERRNPNGRPKAQQPESVLDRALDQKVTLTIDGKRRKVSVGQALMAQLVSDGLKGDKAARREVLRVMQQREAQASTRAASKAASVPVPKMHPPAILFTTYIGNSLEKLGICVEIKEQQLIPKATLLDAWSRLSPERRAEVDLSKLKFDLEDPADIELLRGSEGAMFND